MVYLQNSLSLEEREKTLEEDTIYILLKCCSVSAVAREVASTKLVAISEKFPQILWNKNVIEIMLNLVEALAKSCSHSSLV